jgi:hypothetical protein
MLLFRADPFGGTHDVNRAAILARKNITLFLQMQALDGDKCK